LWHYNALNVIVWRNLQRRNRNDIYLFLGGAEMTGKNVYCSQCGATRFFKVNFLKRHDIHGLDVGDTIKPVVIECEKCGNELVWLMDAVLYKRFKKEAGL